jgi:FAD/FMN-containing dehydrogenase
MTINNTHIDGLDARVITPDSPEYDEARQLFAGGFDRHPALIVRVANGDDVAKAIAYARKANLPLAVRSGGHSGAGHSVWDGAVVIDLRDMRALDIDPRSRTAWAEAGLTAALVTKGVGEHGLVLGYGDTGSVGIGGITLGGGVGYLARKYGLTIDSLIAADMVLADGRRVRVDATHEPDLFWAIRGGGGNFGVATRFQYRLEELPQIVGGFLFQPATTETVRRFVDACAAAPDELTVIANVMPAPPMPMIPEDQHGTLSIFAIVAYAGTGDAAERALAPLRAVAKPIADLLHPMPYAEIYPPDDPSYKPIAANKTLFVDAFDSDSAESVIRFTTEPTSSNFKVAQIRALGGAVSRVPNEATAYGHRQRKFMINIAAIVENDKEVAAHADWIKRFEAALQRGPSGAYVGFLGDEGPARVRAAYPGRTWERLVDAKRRYDPDNVFRLNQNVTG